MKRNWIDNKNVIITGVSSGIGKDIAIRLMTKYNCKVLGVARSVGKLEAIKAEYPDNFDFYPMDVGKRDSWTAFAAHLAEIGWQPDILINNAGIIHPFMSYTDLTVEEEDRVVTTNFLSLLYSCRAMLPLLKKSATPGILNVSSASAFLPVAGASVYSATKAAAYSFSDVLREELSGRNFYVGSVMPGPVKTDLYKTKNQVGEEKAKVADTALFENAGISSEAAARKIVNRMRRGVGFIPVGPLAYGMGIFRNLMPKTSINMMSKIMRKLPFVTFQNIFREENDLKAAKKANKNPDKISAPVEASDADESKKA